ncbi:hypothetical protein NB646_01655 [Oxalobacter aliiformigenes]|uniref:Uncharacterized protein n=1 Tax=Oxalobacter aliiformigenes TaxID=2946593 RepID=A0A9E9LE33_9BURK|nr:hypothetical protein [Oxalobacter aliiformigenes]WAV91496.1 hypothetical protein NB646_01655 [Oxalobacter aliiformigenes]
MDAPWLSPYSNGLLNSAMLEKQCVKPVTDFLSSSPQKKTADAFASAVLRNSFKSGKYKIKRHTFSESQTAQPHDQLLPVVLSPERIACFFVFIPIKKTYATPQNKQRDQSHIRWRESLQFLLRLHAERLAIQVPGIGKSDNQKNDIQNSQTRERYIFFKRFHSRRPGTPDRTRIAFFRSFMIVSRPPQFPASGTIPCTRIAHKGLSTIQTNFFLRQLSHTTLVN